MKKQLVLFLLISLAFSVIPLQAGPTKAKAVTKIVCGIIFSGAFVGAGALTAALQAGAKQDSERMIITGVGAGVMIITGTLGERLIVSGIRDLKVIKQAQNFLYERR